MIKVLQQLEESITTTKSGKRKERLQQLYERCNSVYENISILEMELIWYIRKSKKYRMQGYLIIAKKIYEAEQTLTELIDAADNMDVDKK